MGEQPVDHLGRKFRRKGREMTATVDGPLLDCAAERAIRIARDDCVQARHIQIQIY